MVPEAPPALLDRAGELEGGGLLLPLQMAAATVLTKEETADDTPSVVLRISCTSWPLTQTRGRYIYRGWESMQVSGSTITRTAG